MEQLKVRIQSLQDAFNGEPVVEGLDPKKTNQTKDFTVCILEGGMQSGATSLLFALKFEDGSASVAEMSGKHLEALYKAYLGAQERFKKNKG